MLNTLNIHLKTDIKTDRPTSLPIKLMSQDKNNNQFILRFTNGGESVTLDDTYTVEVLTKFTKSGTSRLTTAKVRQDYATWEFDTAYITQDETVYNYVYVRKSGNLVVSADANCFVFSVDLSEIDKGAGKVAEVYDENYEKVLADYSGALDERTTERLDEAVADFNQRGDAEIADWREYADVELEDYLADRVVLKNFVVNGDFSDGLTGWNNYQDRMNIEFIEDFVRLEGIANGSRLEYSFVINPGDKVYYSVLTRSVNVISSSMGVGSALTIHRAFTNSEDWVNESGVYNINFNNLSIVVGAVGNILDVRHVIAINLTSTFGAGNEPSKESMDRLIEQTGYFDEHILNENWQVGELVRLNDTKANKVQEAWKPIPLTNGWINNLGSYVSAEFYKDDSGVVHLRGSITGGNAQTIGYLPVGYRPDKYILFLVLANLASASASTRTVALYVGPNGEIRSYLSPSDLGDSYKSILSLSSISFRVGG